MTVQYNNEIVLVDIDGTKANIETSFDPKLKLILPKEIYDTRDRSKYWIEEQFDKKYHQKIYDIFLQEGFFLNLNPIEGAIEAIHQMTDLGLDVLICTTPHLNSKFCINEKIAWIKKYFGNDFEKRILPVYDKTLIHGQILIDDKPEISGRISKPSWTHIIFDAPYNQHIDTKYRIRNWSKWRETVDLILKS